MLEPILFLTGLLVLGLFAGSYTAFLLIPITREAVRLNQQRRSSFQLSDRVEQGQIRVNSDDYWQAIEALLPDKNDYFK